MATDVGGAAKPVLGYWNVRGLGAQLRYMLRYCEVDFEQELYNQTFDDGAEGYDRWNRDEWFSVKFTKGLDFPNLPYFIDGDVRLTQSSAIARYICAKWRPELAGRTPADVGAAAMLEGKLSDLNSSLDKIAFFPDGTRERLQECMKNGLEPLRKYLGDKKYVLGDYVTFVDFILFEMIEKAQHEHIYDGKFFDVVDFAAYHATIAALPNMMSADERAKQGHFNGWRAKLGGAGEAMYRKYKKLDEPAAGGAAGGDGW
mmetsp:Transcript_51935/g.127503  ORF Transcript_51935/g.127503 Transcript_51935/m.127503 type:complete len:258 (+) Transcript_51935:21-794(+)